MESSHSRTNNPVVNLSNAVKDVQDGISIPAAAAKHKIPISILFNRVSAIRQLKKKKLHGEMQSSSNESPDEYGLVINDKLFRSPGRFSSKKYVYVNELYYNAVRFALDGNSIDDTILNFKVKRKTLTRKLSDVKYYQKQQSSSNQNKLSRNRLADKKNEKCPSLYNVLKNIIEICDILLPEKFISAIHTIHNGGSFENVVSEFSFDGNSFIKVTRMLRLFQKLPLDYLKSKSNIIQSSLPLIHSSFSNISFTKDESLECLQIYFHDGNRSYEYETLKNALHEIENGLTVTQASKRFNIPYSTLRGKAIQRNIFKGERNSSNVKDMPSCEDDGVKIVSSSPERSIVRPVKSKVKRSQSLCLFCHQPGYREEEIGKLHILNNVVVHYYCLLFSCALEQNGDDDEGILGFLPKDIIKELNRGKRLKCSHCGLKGATIGCSYKNCKRVYHFPCGLDNHAQFIFTDNFSSMCSKHRKYQNGQGKGLTMDCPICLESMEADPKHAVWPPCCKRYSWFHKKCIQKLALSAGYFFKCPLCNDKNIFTSEMLRQGIFVPDQDASWELVPNAYQELLERPIRCTAQVCKCPSGRNSDEEGTRWEVLLCYYCGSTGIHISCGNLKPSSTEWHCPTCIAMLEERSQREQNEVRRAKAQTLKRKQSDLGEENQDSGDEEISGNSLSKRKRRNSSRLSQQPSSSNVSSNSDIDEIISVPRRVRGHIVIRDLIENNEPLNETLREMKQYAENLSQKLVDSKIEQSAFLNLINTTNSSSSHSKKRYIINEIHFQKFETCSLNYDQMRFLRNVFELGFALSLRKSKLNSTQRAKKLNPFCRKKRRYKDVLQVKESLLNLLVKAKSANLLEEDNTWSSYGNRQKNAYFNKVNNDLPSTSSEREIDISETVQRPTSYSSRIVCPIRLMESDEITEECMWCNMELSPGLHPTTFKNLKFSSVTLSVICTSCLTDNIFHNVFKRFVSSLPHPKRLKTEDDDVDNKETDTEKKKNQLKKVDYFSQIEILKEKSKDIKPMTQSTLKPDTGISPSEKVYVKVKETENLMNVKQENKETSVSAENVGSSSILNPSSSTFPEVENNRNSRCGSDKKTEKLTSSISEIENTKSGKYINSASKVPVTPELLIHKANTSNVKEDLLIVNDTVDDDVLIVKDSTKCLFGKLDDTEIKTESPSSISSNTNVVEVTTKKSNSSKSIPSSEKSLKSKNIDGSEPVCTVQNKKPLLISPINKASDSKTNLESTQSPSSSTTTTVMSVDNSYKVSISAKEETVSLKVSEVTSELRSLRPLNTNSSVKIPGESKIDTSDSSSSTSASLRSFRTKDNNSSATVASTKNNSSSDTPAPRQIVLTRSEVLKNMPLQVSVDRDFEAKSENKSASSSGTNNKSTDSISNIKISESVNSAGPSKEQIRGKDNEHTKADPSKSHGESSRSKSLDNTPQTCPPVHQPMSIISNSSKVCKGCKMTIKNESLRKKSKIYCPCCKNVPTFCDKSHFDYYHSHTHHWATIPANDGILRPVRKCRVCTKVEFTRFFCPACPGNFGYCTYEHYIHNHKDQKPKVESSQSPKKNTSEITQIRGRANSNSTTPKSMGISDMQNLQKKVVPQTLTLSSFNFPSINRRIGLNDTLTTPNSANENNESLKGIRISRSTSKEDQKKP